MGFFDLTTEDLSDGKAKFNDGDTATLIISAVTKKVINDAPKIIVECIVADGPQVGLKHAEWFSISTAGGKKALGIFLTSFMTAVEAQAMEDPSALINRKFSVKFQGDFKNMRNIKAISDVPVMEPAPVQQPVQQAQPVQQQIVIPTGQQIDEAVTMGKNMF